MDSTEHRVCSSSRLFPCETYPEVQDWSEKAYQSGVDCLMEGYIPSLPEESYVNLTQNNVFDLTTIWERIDQAAKESFRRKYGDIAALIAVVINEPLLRAAIRDRKSVV